MTGTSDNRSTEEILQACNFELARDDIARFFRMATEEAARSGGSMLYEAAFVDGWQKFSATPNASTARVWLETAPEYEYMIRYYLMKACPEGMAQDMRTGSYNAAVFGVEIRNRFFTVIEKVEAKLGGPAIGIANTEGVLLVHPKLTEELRVQPDAGVLQIALSQCFITKDARRRMNEAWSSEVARYRGKANSSATLRDKSNLLATYVVHNLDAVEIAEGETSDDQDCIVRVEEAAVWYRILDELAFRSIREHRATFMDFLQDDLALNLALLGSSPDLIGETMAIRSREYADYRQWAYADKAGTQGTLLWEAAKHIREVIGLNAHPAFLMRFETHLLDKLKDALIGDLLLGEEMPCL